MSSEYLDHLDADEKGTSVGLAMQVGGHAWLSISEKICTDCVEEDNGVSVWYHLTPDEKGWETANQIAQALTEWVRHTQSISSGTQ